MNTYSFASIVTLCALATACSGAGGAESESPTGSNEAALSVSLTLSDASLLTSISSTRFGFVDDDGVSRYVYGANAELTADCFNQIELIDDGANASRSPDRKIVVTLAYSTSTALRVGTRSYYLIESCTSETGGSGSGSGTVRTGGMR